MTDEEQKAIEKVKEAIRVDKERRIVTTYDEKPLFRDQLQIIIDLINKQQKEIEEKNIAINKMSKDISRQLEEIEKLKFNNHMVGKWNEYLDKDCISKDKIKEKIEHYNNELEHIKNGEEFENEKPMYYWGKVALETLLEEN